MARVLIGIVLLGLIALGAAYIFREELLLATVRSQANWDIAENKPIAWQEGPAARTSDRSDRPPNIIFILADDLGINDISTYGGGVAGGRVPTPNIDRLAAEGANFTQAYSGTGTCAPSRAMLMTGRYPTRTGFEFTPTPGNMGRVISTIANKGRTNQPKVEYDAELARAKPPYEEQGLPGTEVTVAEALKEVGYHTVHIGKWHLGRSGEFSANAQGFDESLLMSGSLFLPEDDPNVVNAKLSFDPIDKFLWASGQYATQYNDSQVFEPGGYLTDYWTDESLKVIEVNKHRPFFLYLAHWGVHTPLQATKEDYAAVGDIEPHRLRVYAAMVRALDRSVGRILDKLDEEGIADNTLVVFTSDNGGAGYIGLPEVNAPYRGWKITLFEGGIRVPMMLRWPAQIPAGTEIETPVAHIDVMPTLTSAAGADLPADIEIDGQDMLPEATGQGAINRPGDAIFWSSGYYQVVRKGDWKLQRNERQNKTWLFDLASDPTEQTNLSESRPDKVDELVAALDTHYANAREPLYPYTVESPIRIDKTNADSFDANDEFVYWPN